MDDKTFYESLSEEAKEQYNKPIDWFKWNVKCCYNCRNWKKDPSLMGDYAYNFCEREENNMMTLWDTCCQHYEGAASETNLIKYKER